MAEVRPPSLCSLCEQFLESWKQNLHRPKYRESFAHHENLQEVRLAASEGCTLCVQFDRVSRYERHPETGSRGFITYVNGQLDKSEPEEQFWVLNFYWSDHSTTNFHNLSLGLVYCAGTNQVPVEDYTKCKSTRSSLPFCKMWLNTCLNSHDHGKRFPALPQTLPTRLLFLGDNNVRVCHTTNLNFVPRYACLSHCWGRTRFQTLGKENLKSFEANVPEEALSKTFRDAIEIARYLDLDYLWIDSLCIIQDDVNDWAHEAALMASVYGCSAVTIAASGAPDGNSGCFFVRPLQWKFRVQASFQDKSYVFSISNSNNPDHESPIAHRAWVFQERMMSPRTLHFTKYQVFGECDECLLSETFPCGVSLRFRDGFNASKFPTTLREWVRMVPYYTSRNLTVSSDRLVAISAVAQRFHLNKKYEYAAGLWKQDFQKQLCWQVEWTRSKGPTNQGSHPYIAPSWSWASIDGVVRLRKPLLREDGGNNFGIEKDGISRLREHTRARKFDITLASQDPFGAVLHASVWLTCRHILRCTKMTSKEEILTLVSSGSNAWDCSYSQDIPEAVQELGVVNSTGEAAMTLISDCELFLVPLFSTSHHHHCLVLEHNPLQMGQFRRVGFAHIIVEQNYPDDARLHNFNHKPPQPVYTFTTNPKDWEGNKDGVQVEVDEEWGWSYTIEIV